MSNGDIPSTMLRAKKSIGKLPSVFTAKNGAVLGCNKSRLYETPFFLQTNPPNNLVAFPPGATSPTTPMRVSAEGPIQINRFGAFRTQPCTVMMWIKDGQSTRQLMNVPIHIDSMFGAGGELYPLPEGLAISEGAAISIAYTDQSAGLVGGSAQIAMSSGKYSKLQPDANLERARKNMQGRSYLALPYWMGLDNQQVTLTAAQQVNLEITVSPDSHFEIHQISFVSDGQFAIDIVDETKGESIINAPSNTHYMIPNLLMCGDGQHPYRLREPRIVFAGQRLLVSLQDTSGLSNKIFLTLGGINLATRLWL